MTFEICFICVQYIRLLIDLEVFHYPTLLIIINILREILFPAQFTIMCLVSKMSHQCPQRVTMHGAPSVGAHPSTTGPSVRKLTDLEHVSFKGSLSNLHVNVQIYPIIIFILRPFAYFFLNSLKLNLIQTQCWFNSIRFQNNLFIREEYDFYNGHRYS